METSVNSLTPKTSFYVMNKSEGTWVRVSGHFSKFDDAQKELNRLRKEYPFARLGGTRRF